MSDDRSADIVIAGWADAGTVGTRARERTAVQLMGATRTTRHGNGRGWGGPARGSGTGGEAKPFEPGNQAAVGHGPHDLAKLGMRAEQVERAKDMLLEIALDPQQPGSARVMAAERFMDRELGKPMAQFQSSSEVHVVDERPDYVAGMVKRMAAKANESTANPEPPHDRAGENLPGDQT